MSAVVSFFIGLLSIALMVTIHETGHFIFARLSGISVEVFAIGWGKSIKRWRSKGVEYRINIFPLGGYCRLKGAEDLQRGLETGGDDFETVDPGSLFAVSAAKRIPTYLAGPLFNLLFALILFVPFLMMDYQGYGEPNTIIVSSDFPTVFGLEEGSENAAKKAGIQSGDTIIAIDGQAVSDFSEIQKNLAARDAESPTRFTIVRGMDTRDIMVTPEYDEVQDRVLFGIASKVPAVVGAISELSPESQTPMKAGDTILAVQGIAVNHTVGVMDVLLEHPDTVSLTVEHADDSRASFTYVPQRDMQGNNRYGFSFIRPIETKSGLPFARAVIGAFEKTIESMKNTILMIPRLFQDGVSLNGSVAGPLRISYVIGEMRNSGLRSTLHLLAMVSISLAMANLLPIPGLDGGAILFSILELFRGKRISPRWYVRFQAVGMLFLMFIMVLVLFGDIRYFFLGS